MCRETLVLSFARSPNCLAISVRPLRVNIGVTMTPVFGEQLRHLGRPAMVHPPSEFGQQVLDGDAIFERNFSHCLRLSFQKLSFPVTVARTMILNVPGTTDGHFSPGFGGNNWPTGK